jgi:hypothetical protein
MPTHPQTSAAMLAWVFSLASGATIGLTVLVNLFPVALPLIVGAMVLLYGARRLSR